MRKSKQCPKCDSTRIGVYGKLYGCNSHVTNQPVESWICADCGYYETYVKSPNTTRLDMLLDFRWANQGR